MDKAELIDTLVSAFATEIFRRGEETGELRRDMLRSFAAKADQAQAVQKNLDGAHEEINRLSEELEKARSDLKTWKAEAQKLRRVDEKNRVLSGALKAKSEGLEGARAELESTRAELDAAQAELARLRSEQTPTCTWYKASEVVPVDCNATVCYYNAQTGRYSAGFAFGLEPHECWTFSPYWEGSREVKPAPKP